MNYMHQNNVIIMHPSIQDTAEDHKRKFGDVPATEGSLRELAAIPSWASVPPLVVELVNQHLGHDSDTVDDGGEVPDLLGTLFNGLDSLFPRK
jgi:hypothetical protein